MRRSPSRRSLRTDDRYLCWDFDRRGAGGGGLQQNCRPQRIDGQRCDEDLDADACRREHSFVLGYRIDAARRGSFFDNAHYRTPSARTSATLPPDPDDCVHTGELAVGAAPRSDAAHSSDLASGRLCNEADWASRAPKLVLRLRVAGGGDLNRCAVYLPTARRRRGRHPRGIS